LFSVLVAAKINGVTLNSKRYFDFAAATAPGLPHWSKLVLHPLLKYYTMTTKLRKLWARNNAARISKKTLISFFYPLEEFYRLGKKEALPKEVTHEALDYIDVLTKGMSLDDNPQPRAELTPTSLYAITRSVFHSSLPWTMQKRFETAMYISIAVATGMRSCSILRYRRAPVASSLDPFHQQEARKDGARWADFTFTMTPTGPIVTFTPVGGKTDNSRNQKFVLASTGCLGLSAGYITTITAFFSGAFEGVKSLAEVFEPAFLRGKRERKIPLHALK
jgi:hypothetical protein